MKKLNKVMEEIVEPTTDMVLYDPNYRPIYVNIPCNKYDTDDKPKYGIDLKWRPKGYGEEWGIVRRPTHDIGLVPIEHPTPSIMDFVEHGRKLENIYNWIMSFFNKSDIYWDEYGVYDRDTGLMLEYYAPDANEEVKESVFPLQTNTKQVSESKKHDFWETIEKTSNYYQDNFAKNLANKMDAERKNAEFKKAMTFIDRDVDYRKEMSKIESDQLIKAHKETYIITEYIGRLSHPTKNCWRMSLSEPILLSNKGPDIFQLKKDPGHYFAVMDTGMKEGLSIGYDFISIRDYDGVFNVKISSIKPGDEIERVNYNDIKDKI